MHRTWSFYIVVVQGTTKKCTKNYNARAQPLFSSLNLLFGRILVAIAVVVCLQVLANEDTLLRTHCCRHKCFPVCPRAQHLLRTQKMFLILFRNILCPQQMFPSLCSPRNIMGNNVSATMCPRLPGPLSLVFTSDTSTNASNRDDPSENEIRRKHKHKQNHLNLPNCLGAR